MKRKFTLLFALVACMISLHAQTFQINEGFTSPFSGPGWFVQNNSVPTGTINWFQGQGTIFPALSGGQDDYFATGFNAQGNGPGGASNFLITPTVTLMNGGVLKFATRTATTAGTVYPDRLQVRMSQGSGTGGIGTGTTAVGTFTTLLFDINPNLTSTGYPTSWTVYTTTLSGITGTVAGRFTFRYFVVDAGPNGTNGDYIGIDDVQYSLPAGCIPPVITINPNAPTVCGGGAANLTASGAASYTWSNGSNASSINVSPSSTTVYTVSGSNIPGCVGVTTTTVSVVSQPTVSVNSNTVCGTVASVLTASGATSYQWSNGFSAPSITVSPSSTTSYTVIGTVGTCTSSAIASVIFTTAPTISAPNVTACPNQGVAVTASGANSYTWSNGGNGPTVNVAGPSSFTLSVIGSNGPGCFDTKVVAVNINTFLVAPTSLTACPNAPLPLSASGALVYNWSNGATTSSIIVTPTANTTYTVSGNDGNCQEVKTITVTIDPNITVPNFTTCAGTAATLQATGATSYTWSNGSNSNVIVVTPTANTVYTVTGGNGNCTQTKTVSVTIGNNLSVNATYTCVNTQIILTASGASNYTWAPGGQNSASIIFTPTAAAVYTVAGSSGTCTGQSTVTVAYCAGFDENSYLNNSMIVYPNPFTSDLTISGAYGDVKVINSLGQVIVNSSVEESTTISTAEFAPGIYYIVVSNSETNERKIVKVIKQ